MYYTYHIDYIWSFFFFKLTSSQEVKGHLSPVSVSVWRPGPLCAGAGGWGVWRPAPPPPPPPRCRRRCPLPAGRSPGSCGHGCWSLPPPPVLPVLPQQRQRGRHSRGRQQGQRRHLRVRWVHWHCKNNEKDRTKEALCPTVRSRSSSPLYFSTNTPWSNRTSF